MAKIIVMARPDYFDVVYKINPWMDPEKPTSNTVAYQEWEKLKKIYEQTGAEISVIDSVINLPDLVFSANAFFAIGKKAVLARFRYPQRQGETEVNKKWLEKNGFDIIDPGEVVYEGEGDTFLVGDTIFQGYGFRSDAGIGQIIQQTFPDKQVYLLKLVDERFYHTDTCFFPISKDLVFYHAPAFDSESEKTIKTQFKEAIAVTDEEANNFSLNAIKINETVVINAQSEIFGRRLQSYGFQLQMVDTSEFQKSGGSVKCMSNEVY